MKKYYDGDTGGKYLIGTKSAGFFADVQSIWQAESAARTWRAMTDDDGEVIIWSREKEKIEKIMWRKAEEGKTEMTDKEKIIEIIAPYVSAYGDDEAIADAIIAAGFKREK